MILNENLRNMMILSVKCLQSFIITNNSPKSGLHLKVK